MSSAESALKSPRRSWAISLSTPTLVSHVMCKLPIISVLRMRPEKRLIPCEQRRDCDLGDWTKAGPDILVSEASKGEVHQVTATNELRVLPSSGDSQLL